MEKCANCHRVIGDLEVVWVYRDKPVCGECRERLRLGDIRPEGVAYSAAAKRGAVAAIERWCYSDPKWVCTACAKVQTGRKRHKGSLGLEVCLWAAGVLVAGAGVICTVFMPLGLLAVIAGLGMLAISALPYSLWRQFSKSRRCESCGAEALIPSSSPMARQVLSGKIEGDSMATEKCANCGAPIGALETPMVWNGSVVCKPCRIKLGGTESAPGAATKEHTLYEATHHWVFFLRPRVVIASLTIIGLIYFVMVFRTTRFVVTNKRVMRQFGIFGRDSWELMLKQVSAINVNRGIFDRMAGTGQVVITAAGGATETFLAIKDPKRFQQTVVDATP